MVTCEVCFEDEILFPAIKQLTIVSEETSYKICVCDIHMLSYVTLTEEGECIISEMINL